MVDAYINTPIAPMLPVELELGKLPVSTVPRRRFSTPPPQDQQPSSNESYVLQLTPEGKADPLMVLADDPRANIAHWR